jgi:hypothetical protein
VADFLAATLARAAIMLLEAIIARIIYACDEGRAVTLPVSRLMPDADLVVHRSRPQPPVVSQSPQPGTVLGRLLQMSWPGITGPGARYACRRVWL